MSKTLLAGVVCLLASAAFTAGEKVEPLNVKTGLWQVTETYSATGLPAGIPANHTTNYKTCVTKKDLESNPFREPDDKCSWKVLNSSASDMEVSGTACDMGNQGMKADFHLKLHVVDSEHVQGSGDWKADGGGMSMNGRATGNGKWISASCPAE